MQRRGPGALGAHLTARPIDLAIGANVAASDRNASEAVGIAAGRDFQRDHSPGRRNEAQRQSSHREADEESDLEAHLHHQATSARRSSPSTGEREFVDIPSRGM
jgi:hypothetical protein